MKVELNIVELKKMQQKMDAEAAKVHGLDIKSREWFENRTMAIIGELYETMAVVETFKDWKINKGKTDESFYTFVKSVDDGIESQVKVFCLNKDVYQPLSKTQAIHLTLIEECSDVLHFMLTLINVAQIKDIKRFDIMQGDSIQLLKSSIRRVLELEDAYTLNNFKVDTVFKEQTSRTFATIMNYFESLGVTQEELEQAYHDKHKINQERLENGY